MIKILKKLLSDLSDIKESKFWQLVTIILFVANVFFIVSPPSLLSSLSTSLLLFLNLIIILSLIYFDITGLIIFGLLSLLVILLHSLRIAQFKILPIVSLGATIFIFYIYFLKEAQANRRIHTELDHIDEEKNLLNVELKHAHSENSALKQKLQRYEALKNLTEMLSSVLSLEEVTSLISEQTFRIIGKSNVCLLYLVAHQRQGLYLASKKTQDIHYEINAKDGDLFDDWVFKRRTRLMIRDIKKDFRFNIHEIKGEDSRDVRSLVSAPLIIGNKFLGILRLDNTYREEMYNADELRLLDIISDLAAVAIQNAIFYQRTQELAITDGLTGLFVYRHFHQRLDQEISRALWTNSQFAFLMLDIDHFKNYNDKYGHIAGDIVLKQIAKLIRLSVNPGDIVARYGGEEFAILLVDTTKMEAIETAQRIRKTIAEKGFMLRREITKVNVSGGLSFFSDEKDKEELIRKADFFLYKAKSEGKNRICSY